VAFEEVRFYHFRNIADGTVSLSSRQIFLVGENGQGKSNFLESLYLLSYGGSFRTRRDSELCRTGERDMAVDGTISNAEGSHRIQIRFQDGKKKINLDSSPVTDRRDMISMTPVVVFRHDDMAFVNGSPEMQRWFVDQTLSMNRPGYVNDLRRYRIVLKNRNHAIRNEQLDLLDIYDNELAEAGLKIQRDRATVIRAFNDVFQEDFLAISGLEFPLVLEYRPSWRGLEGTEEVVEELESRRLQEQNLRTTTSGPHRDRLLFRYRERDFLQVASTGQIRLVALILRVAQARFFGKTTGRLPILLLDDVLLELDPGRRSRFVERLPLSEQRIFTFLPGEPYHAYRNDETLIYFVENGTVRRE
jgi:DNA replication and repair protein RecF